MNDEKVISRLFSLLLPIQGKDKMKCCKEAKKKIFPSLLEVREENFSFGIEGQRRKEKHTRR